MNQDCDLKIGFEKYKIKQQSNISQKKIDKKKYRKFYRKVSLSHLAVLKKLNKNNFVPLSSRLALKTTNEETRRSQEI